MSAPIIARGSLVTIAGRNPDDVFKVMAIADGYAMCRYPRCVPFVEPLKNLQVAGPEDSR